MFKLSNQKIVTVKMKRKDICELMVACSALCNDANADSEKWRDLHDRLKEIIDDFDSKQNCEVIK